MWSNDVSSFLGIDPQSIVHDLAATQMRQLRISEVQQHRAWEESIALLRRALSQQTNIAGWHLILEYPMLRLGRRADAILLLPHMIIVLEFKIGACAYLRADREQVEDYAIDLRDFHAASRSVPILPILVASEAPPPASAQRALAIAAVAGVADANASSLGSLITELASMPPSGQPLDPSAWQAAPYRPVPNIIEAACMLYAGHGVDDIRAARADAHNLSITTAAIKAAVAQAKAGQTKRIVFVTGIPGAGKTLCGLNAALCSDDTARATFLTGNPSLVHVLREALASDAIQAGAHARATRQHMESVIQALPRFRDHYVARPAETPSERIIVVDEAQRCWSAAYARSKTRDRPVRLTESEPRHLLDIMARHDGFAAVICLVGSGQEIHKGEGGLQEWGDALRQTTQWSVLAAPDIAQAADPRQRLGPIDEFAANSMFHLQTPVRQIRFDGASHWADAVLRGDAATARATATTAESAFPFRLTRSLSDMRRALRHAARGQRRAGLLASSGGRRLRAEGLGVELPHMDASAVAHWFLDRFPPDVRAANSLEIVATEFSCQGLELDYAGLCWDADLIRLPQQQEWCAREFRGTHWTMMAKPENIANQINTYRVLLTRARYDTIIFVPLGDVEDTTRDPSIYDSIATFLQACGATDLEQASIADDDAAPLSAPPESALL